MLYLPFYKDVSENLLSVNVEDEVRYNCLRFNNANEIVLLVIPHINFSFHVSVLALQV